MGNFNLMRLITLLICSLVLFYGNAQETLEKETQGWCELFPNKYPNIDKSKRLKALREMEGDSVMVVILNKKEKIIRKQKGVVWNLSLDMMKKANMHATLVMANQTKRGK